MVAEYQYMVSSNPGDRSVIKKSDPSSANFQVQ